MSAKPPEPFQYPAQASEAAWVFFIAADHVRQFVVDYVAALQGRDLALLIGAHQWLNEAKNIAEVRAWTEQHPDDFRQMLRELNIPESDAEQVLVDPARMALLMTMTNRQTAVKAIEMHGTFLLETMLTRAHDAFTVYLADLLKLVIDTRVGRLRPRADAFIRKAMDAHLATVTSSRDKLHAEFKRAHNLDLFLSASDKDRETLIAEQRHVIVHHGGRISKKFVQNVRRFTKYTDADINQPLRLDTNSVIADLLFLQRVVKDIDERAAKKFGLPQVPNPVASDDQSNEAQTTS